MRDAPIASFSRRTIVLGFFAFPAAFATLRMGVFVEDPGAWSFFPVLLVSLGAQELRRRAASETTATP